MATEAKKETTEVKGADLLGAALEAETARDEATAIHEAQTAEAVKAWNAYYDRLAEIKRQYEHNPSAAIQHSRLWAILAGIADVPTDS